MNKKTLSKELFNDFIVHRLEVLRANIEKVTGKAIKEAEGKFEKK